MIIIEKYLIHYGVGHDKGGHSGRYPWGSGKKSAIRKQARAEKLAMKYNELTGKDIADHVSTRKRVSDMSDDELQTKINRLRLEETYTMLNAKLYPEHVSAGKKFINNMKENLSRDIPNVLSTKLKDAVGKKIDQVIKDQFNTDIPMSVLLKKDLGKLNDSELKRVTDHWNALKNAKDAEHNARKTPGKNENSNELLEKKLSDLSDKEIEALNRRVNFEANIKSKTGTTEKTKETDKPTETTPKDVKSEYATDGAEFLKQVQNRNLKESLHTEYQRDDESGADFLERILREYR